MVDETDGIEEAITGQIRVAVTAAAQVGQAIGRAREEALRRAATLDERQARELRSRLDAERAAARAEVAQVNRSEWWDNSTPEQIGRTYQVARAWQGEDSEISRAEQRMSDELRSRYGIDVHDTGASPDDVRQLIRLQSERAERDRQSDGERTRAAAEEAEALRLLAVADQEDWRADEARAAAEFEPDAEERERARDQAEQHERTADRAREDGKTTYDSADRRSSTATELERRGIAQETVATRMRADVSQAKPATAAVAAGKTKAAKARKTRGRGAQVQRTGLDR